MAVCNCSSVTCPLAPNDEEQLSSANLHGFNAAQARTIGIDYNLAALIDQAKADKPYQQVVTALRNNTDPNSLPQSHPARQYKSVWKEISQFDEHPLLVLRGHRIIVPQSCRKDILSLLHRPHIGQVGTKKTAQQLYYWPSINNDIKLLCETCEPCRQNLQSREKEPLVQTRAEYPLQMLSTDLYSVAGHDYLISADRYSGFIWVDKLHKLSTNAVIKKLEDRFNDMAFLPQSIRADNGPQFRDEFQEWCDSKGIHLDHSAPYNSQSNGHAEAGVKNAKHLLIKCKGIYNEDFRSRLREWINSPRADGYSPAQMMYGRRQRGDLPVLPNAYDPIDTLDAELKRQAKQDKNKDSYDRATKPIKEMTPGTKVLVQDVSTKKWNIPGTVHQLYQDGRCLKIQLSNGKFYYRNRRHVRPA